MVTVGTGEVTTIVGFGDSITAAVRQPAPRSWLGVLGGLLSRHVPQRRFRCVNAGVGGNTSREGLARIETDVLGQSPDVVLVQFGGNDATADSARHVEPSDYEANLGTIRALIGERTGAGVVLLTFPPVINAWHAWGAHPFYEPWGGPDGCVEIYREITRAFASRHGLPLADLDGALRRVCDAQGAGSVILPDGVHLTEFGNKVVAEAVSGILCSLLGQACVAGAFGATQRPR